MAPSDLFRRPDCGRNRSFHLRSLGRQLRLPLRLHDQLFDLHGSGESTSLHFGWSDLEAQRRPYRGIAFEFAGQAIDRRVGYEFASCGRMALVQKRLAGGAWSQD